MRAWVIDSFVLNPKIVCLERDRFLTDAISFSRIDNIHLISSKWKVTTAEPIITAAQSKMKGEPTIQH